MPHIVVEYTDQASSDIPKLLDVLHHALAAQETVDINAIKTRAIPVQDCLVGDGQKPNEFIHITLRLFFGRDEALRTKIAKTLHHKASEVLSPQSDVALSLEVVEMNPKTYVK